MSILNKLLKKESFQKTKWTDFDRPPREVFLEACEFIAQNLKEHGFEFAKSGPHLTKNSSNGDFRYIINFGTTSRNHRNELVLMDIYVIVKSKKIKSYRKKLIDKYPDRNLGQPDDLVTSIGLGYLTEEDSFLAGSWNLVKTIPKLIASMVEKYALPSFEKFENIENLMKTLIEKGGTKEFNMEFRTLDFLMCFGNNDYAHDGLIEMLINRNWITSFHELYADLENGRSMKDKRALLTNLVERAYLYGLRLKK